METNVTLDKAFQKLSSIVLFFDNSSDLGVKISGICDGGQYTLLRKSWQFPFSLHPLFFEPFPSAGEQFILTIVYPCSLLPPR